MGNYMDAFVEAEENRIEREIISSAVTALIKEHGAVRLQIDGERIGEKFKSAKAVLKKLDEYYASQVAVYPNSDQVDAWIKFVMGNVDCVLSDYTVNLEEILKPTNALAETYS